jgi:cysteine-rich repeat protein
LGTTFLQDFVCTGSAQTVTVTSTLSAGVHQFNFTQENLCGGISSASISLPVTIDTTAPTVSSYSPTDGATGVSGTTPLVVTFNESIYEGTGNITVYKTSGAVQTYQVAVASTTVGSTSVTTSALTGLVGGTDYYVYTDGIVKDLAGNSFAGISNSATWNFQTGSICGDGVLTGSEECEAGACCDTGTCTLYGGATTCRNSAGVCDLAETCASATVSGVTAACPTDVFQANTQVCNAASGACDIAEYCTGSAAACPSDSYEAAGTTCRVAAGVCDIAETCTGSSPACPADTLHSSGTVCATASDTCGTNATCDGVSTACPSTGYVAGGTLCNAISNLCCSGTSDSCSGSCGGTTPYCGDGTVQSSNAEACDDGNTNSGDGCSASCVNESCGDGIVQPGEACDAGGQNGVSGSGCSSTCTSGGGPGGPNYPGIEYCCPGGYGSNNYCIPKYSTNLANCPGAFSTQASCNAACFPPTTNSSASSAKSVPVGCTQTTLPNGLIGISCSSASVNAGRQVICWDVLNGIMLGIMAPPVCVFPNSIAISNITTIPDFVVRYQLNTDDNCLETYRCSVTSAMGECVPALNSLSSGTVSGGPKLPGNFTSTKPVPPASLGVTAYSYCL